MNGKPVRPEFRHLVSLVTTETVPTLDPARAVAAPPSAPAPLQPQSPTKPVAEPDFFGDDSLPSKPVAVRRDAPASAQSEPSAAETPIGSPFSMSLLQQRTQSAQPRPAAAPPPPKSGSPFSTARRLEALNSGLPKVKSPQPFPFVFSYRRSDPSVYGPERGQFMDVFLQNVCFSPAAVLFKLPVFFAIPPDAISPAPPQPQSPTKPKPPSASDEPPYPVHLRAHMLQPTLHLVADPTGTTRFLCFIMYVSRIVLSVLCVQMRLHVRWPSPGRWRRSCLLRTAKT
jgi:hypothetical protein